MQKFVTVISVLIITAFIAGCGGGSSTAANTTFYARPTPAANPSTSFLMGGAVQGGVIADKLSNYSVSTFAGTAGTTGFTNDSATTPPTTAKFNRPMGITTDGKNIYVTDYINNAIRQIDQNGVVTTFAGSDAGIAGATDGIGTAARFNQPTDITTDGTNLYVVDSGNNVIRIIDKDKNVTTIGSTTGLAGAVDVNKIVAPATTADVTQARFNQPIGITTDGTNLYVTDSGNHTIRTINILLKTVTTLAGAPGAAGPDDGKLSDDNSNSSARFNVPAHITTNGTNLYVTDFNNRAIRKIEIATGTVTTIAGKADTPPGTDDANKNLGTDARFNQPNGITTDGKNLYVTDSFNNTIRKISLDFPHKVEKIAGITYFSGQAQATGHVDSANGDPSFWSPTGITSDGTSLYVADSGNHTIRKIK